MQHRVRDLSPDARKVAEQLVGKPLLETDVILISSIPLVKDGPTPEERVQAAKELDDYFRKIDKKMEGVDPVELDDAINEAIREVRKSRLAAK